MRDVRRLRTHFQKQLDTTMITITKPMSACFTALLLCCSSCLLRAGEAVWTAASGLFPTNASPSWYFYSEPASTMTIGAGSLRIETSPAFARATYFHDRDVLSIPTNFVIEARVRYISGSSTVPGRAAAGISFFTRKGVANWLWIGQDEVFVNSGARLQRGAVASVDTDDAFHTYRIEFHGVASGSGFDVFHDGTLVLSGSLFLDDEDQEPEIGWGDVAYEASGVSEWQSFRHNASAAPTVSIFAAAEICWSSETNRTYQVQWAPALPATNWTDLGSAVAGTGTNVCVFDSTRGSGRRFYRVEVVP